MSPDPALLDILSRLRAFIRAENVHARFCREGDPRDRTHSRDEADFAHASLVGKGRATELDAAVRNYRAILEALATQTTRAEEAEGRDETWQVVSDNWAITVAQQDEIIDALRAKLAEARKVIARVARKLDGEADNISPTNGVHPAPWMRKRAEELRRAAAFLSADGEG